MKLDKELICMINTLYLLEKGEKTWLELWQSCLFRSHIDLTSTLKRLKKAGCINRIRIGGYYEQCHIYTITPFGREMLNVFPNWKPRKVISQRKLLSLPGYRERKEKEERASKSLEERVVQPLGLRAKLIGVHGSKVK